MKKISYEIITGYGKCSETNRWSQRALCNKAKILPMDSKNLKDCLGWSTYHTDLIPCRSQELWSRGIGLFAALPLVCIWTVLHLESPPALPQVLAPSWPRHQALPDQLIEVTILRILPPCSIFICDICHSRWCIISVQPFTCLLSLLNTNSTTVGFLFSFF